MPHRCTFSPNTLSNRQYDRGTSRFRNTSRAHLPSAGPVLEQWLSTNPSPQSQSLHRLVHHVSGCNHLFLHNRALILPRCPHATSGQRHLHQKRAQWALCAHTTRAGNLEFRPRVECHGRLHESPICCEPWSEYRPVLGGFTHLLDAGIDLRATKLFMGLIHLKCPCTLYDMLFKTISVVICNVYSDCKIVHSGNCVSLCLSNDLCVKWVPDSRNTGSYFTASWWIQERLDSLKRAVVVWSALGRVTGTKRSAHAFSPPRAN